MRIFNCEHHFLCYVPVFVLRHRSIRDQADSLQHILAIFQRLRHDLIHIIILIFCKPPAEDDVPFGVCEGFISRIERIILIIVDWIIRFVAELPLVAVFTADYGLWQVVALLVLAELGPLVFNNPRL